MIKQVFFIYLMLNNHIVSAATSQQSEKAIFAGGCFWCMEKPFDELSGVLQTTPGYIGGHTQQPSYKEVSAGKTGHYEAIQIVYDPVKISFQQLLKVFWNNIDPTNDNGQFCDEGPQYRSAIFYLNDKQKQLAIESKQKLEQKMPDLGMFKTSIVKANIFYPAEDYHHDYYLNNPFTYKFYRFTCGRDSRLKKIWGTSAN